MATYSIVSPVHYHLNGWSTLNIGATSKGCAVGGEDSTEWRTVMGIKVTPGKNERVTKLSLNVGYLSDKDAATQLGGYLYTDFDVAKVVSGPPSGYIAHAEETTAIKPTVNGRMTTLTWTGLNITKETTLYVWFYVTPGWYSQIWLGNSGYCKVPTATGVAVKSGLVHIENGISWEDYFVYIHNGESWDMYVPYIHNGESWNLLS